ncbi:hypothetical protein SBP18_07450 [Rhodoferax ferrireducens]|uniref:hypothetical protein n=1 Tax=Rhodoferax ferrireducens TaxID=192843 RepID=UPI00298EA831|nr:hypothetical protein [Rhodoferax ferrireducens]WPC68331.1 hypothetical protein SBP18_07450 [Rhodoferax ferrireducens]
MKNTPTDCQFALWSPPIAIVAKPAPDWRITLRSGMVAADHPQTKVFTSVAAFQGYVSDLRAHGVVVSFTTPFVAACQEAS